MYHASSDSYVSTVLFAAPQPVCGFGTIGRRWRHRLTMAAAPAGFGRGEAPVNGGRSYNGARSRLAIRQHDKIINATNGGS